MKQEISVSVLFIISLIILTILGSCLIDKIVLGVGILTAAGLLYSLYAVRKQEYESDEYDSEE